MLGITISGVGAHPLEASPPATKYVVVRDRPVVGLRTVASIRSAAPTTRGALTNNRTVGSPIVMQAVRDSALAPAASTRLCESVDPANRYRSLPDSTAAPPL